MFWFKGKKVKEPLPEEYRKTHQAIVDEALKRDPVCEINNLIPPFNLLYPWKAEGWQMLCYYCNQPIYLIKNGNLEAGYRQRGPLNYGWRHENNEWACKLENVRTDIDLPRCHICMIQTPPHQGVCSAAGLPSFHATTMSDKEEEVQRCIERERGREMHDALYALLQEYRREDGVSRAAICRVLKLSPWGSSVK